MMAKVSAIPPKARTATGVILRAISAEGVGGSASQAAVTLGKCHAAVPAKTSAAISRKLFNPCQGYRQCAIDAMNARFMI